MSRILRFCAIALLLDVGVPLTGTSHAADSVPALKQIASIELPGPPGKRFDYLVINYDDG